MGRGMRASTKAREDIFLETKIWPCFYQSETAVDETLERLDTDYIDLLLLHQYAGDIKAGYRHLEEAYKAGKVRASGNDSIMSEPVVVELAEKYGKSPAQIILRWRVQEGHSIVPGSKTPSHIA